MLSSLIRPLLLELQELKGLIREQNSLMRDLYHALMQRPAPTPRNVAPSEQRLRTDKDVMRVTRSEIAAQQAKEREKVEAPWREGEKLPSTPTP